MKAGECVDLGSRLWADNFYDNLVSSHQELINVRNYTLKNPERWEDDRFGAVTSFSVGNLELLSSSLVAFVASDTHDKWGEEKPHVRAVHEVSRTEAGDARYKAEAGDARYKAEAGDARYKAEAGDARYKAKAGDARYKANLKELPLVSTFSSFEEQGALAQRLEAKRPFVWVDPAGVRANLPASVKAACDEGWGLVISPVASGTGLNKQRAIWCNRWVLKVAERIYVGTIKKGGTLDTLLSSYMVAHLVRNKSLECARFRRYVAVAVDGVEQEVTRLTKGARTTETRYQLEAKVIAPNGISLSVMSERVRPPRD